MSVSIDEIVDRAVSEYRLAIETDPRATEQLARKCATQIQKDAMRSAIEAIAPLLAAQPPNAQQVAQTGVPEECVVVKLDDLEDIVDDAKHYLASDLGWDRYGKRRYDIGKRYDAMLAASPVPTKQATEWQPIETAPKDGTEVALLFATDDDVFGIAVPRVRAAKWVTSVSNRGEWGIPYYLTNPPIAWHPMPGAPLAAAPTQSKEGAQ